MAFVSMAFVSFRQSRPAMGAGSTGSAVLVSSIQLFLATMEATGKKSGFRKGSPPATAQGEQSLRQTHRRPDVIFSASLIFRGFSGI
jgi:hypothetical protein